MFDNWYNFLLIFSAGLFGSFHCIGMCSPIIMMLVNRKLDEFRSALLYNFGRIFSYSFLGFMSGWIGHRFMEVFDRFKFFPKLISVVFGVIMIIISIEMIFRIKTKGLPFLQPFHELMSDFIAATAKRPSHWAPLFIGLFNGFLPCPLVYGFMMQAASTMDPIQGFTVMLFMGLGTLPAMLFLGRFLLYRGNIWLRSGFVKVAGLIICYLGVVSILRGLNILHGAMHHGSHGMH